MGIIRDDWRILEDVVEVQHKPRTCADARDGYITLIFEGGGKVHFMTASECSGFTLQHFRWAKISPHLFTYYLIENKVLHLYCPYSESGYFTDIPYFEKGLDNGI